MTSLYEYKHPIINKQLASGSDDHSGRKFPTLNAWYSVVNDYEFQARCPIILKNSHRNKHFTFACHLKDCPFKVLLSYCGNQRGLENEQQTEHQHQHHELNHSLVSLERKPKLEEQEGVKDGGQQGAAEGDARKYTEADAEDDDVSAAIAAAVAAVQDVRQKDGGFGEEYGNGGRASEGAVRGPFVVTKIEPYHNHPLESNLTLSKFVLTKVPRILQHDLNFDQILESLCNEDDNTVSKFRVSQYVEESGLLDILKERYGLTDAEIDKKLLSHISRRVTTYKARFVLKKKKNGEYGNAGAARGQNGAGAHGYPRHARAAAMEHLGHPGGGVADHGDSGRVNGRHLQSLHDGNLNPELNDAEVQAAQAAAQAAIGEAVALKRSVQQMVGDDDVDDDASRKRHMMKLSTSMGGSLVNDDGSLVALDDTQDDKLPRDVAEQLRLLSSHFKEVEAHNLNNSGCEPDEETKLVVKDDIPDENIQPELRGQ
ncbi:hypothetical protein HG536_0A03910 [Torulaspora globosa]|uniref:Uncharacterized protein n=1 Tax=Torulaspora globosa TaxID=48254 RepID=A0A7G3ZAN7_9SACH|nr:uncharacterized protein HG536_0A03910 [Torulaspora globosa]QLL30573.1 hypothetical protein HG536_0A03910 [Torulaspora globosa]